MLKSLPLPGPAFLLVSALAVTAGPGPGQSEPPKPPSKARVAAQQAERATELLRLLRRKGASERVRVTAIDELMQLGWNGPHRLAVELESQLRRLRRAIATHRRTLLKAFGKRSRKMMASRLHPRARRDLDRQREIVRRNSRRGGLTKTRIKTESDAAVEKIRALLTITVDQVFEDDEKLGGQHEALLDSMEREASLYSDYLAARDRAQSHPDASPEARARKPVEPTDEEQRQALAQALDSLASDATPISGSDRKILERNEQVRDQLQPQEFAGILFLNRLRILLGIRPYVIDVKLCRAARGHSTDMKERGFFSHTSPVPGKRSPGQRAALEGTSGGAENIARGARTGRGSIMQWWYSPGHHRNMMGSASRIGLGQCETFWTQMFG